MIVDKVDGCASIFLISLMEIEVFSNFTYFDESHNSLYDLGSVLIDHLF